MYTYKVVRLIGCKFDETKDLDEFASHVNIHTTKGWEVCGGIQVVVNKKGMVSYYQAMQKKGKLV